MSTVKSFLLFIIISPNLYLEDEVRDVGFCDLRMKLTSRISFFKFKFLAKLGS